MRCVTVALAAMLCVSEAVSQEGPDARLLASLESAIDSGKFVPLPDGAGVDHPAMVRGIELVAEWRRTGARTTLERALREFNVAASARADRYWPRYIMARVFLEMHLLDLPTLNSDGKAEGEFQADAFWRLIEETLSRNPDFAPARDEAIHRLTRATDRALDNRSRRILTAELARPDAFPGAWLVEGRRLRGERLFDSALVAFERAGSLGYDHTVVDIELARTLVSLGRTGEAVARYWMAVNDPTPEGREFIRQDLGWLVPQDSLAAYDRLPDDSIAGWLRIFWGARDAAVARESGSRLREHMARWAAAHANYRVTLPRRRTMMRRVDMTFDPVTMACVGSPGDFFNRLPTRPPSLAGDIRSDEPLLDHRGLMYMKHGAPFATSAPAPTTATVGMADLSAVASSADDQEGTEASTDKVEIWVYWLEGAWRVLTFRGSSALGLDSPSTLARYLLPNSDTWAALAAMLPEYRAAAMRLERTGTPYNQLPCLQDVLDGVIRQEADARVAVETDSDSPRITTPWNVSIRSFALAPGRAGDDPRLLVTWSVPQGDLSADTLMTGQVLWRLGFRMAAFRMSDGMSVSIDSTRRIIGRPLGEHDMLTGWFEIPLPAGQWQLAVITSQQDSTAGGYTLRRGIRLSDDGALFLSDVVTGLEGEPAWTGAWDGPFPVNSRGVWNRGGTAELYYEMGGIGVGEEYRTTIQVIPLDRNRDRRIEVTTTGQSWGGRFAVRRTLGLDELPEGNYNLIVTIRVGDREVSREQRILIR